MNQPRRPGVFPVHQREKLVAHLVIDPGQFPDEFLASAVGVLHVDGGAVVTHAFRVEAQVERAVPVRDVVVVPALPGSEPGGVALGFFGCLPGRQVELNRAVGHFLLLTLGPNLLDRGADDAHQLVAEGEAHAHGDQQREHHARDDDAQVLKMLKERLFLVLMRLVAQLEYFLEHVHAAARMCIAYPRMVEKP